MERKANVFLILKALEKYTDDNHYIGQTELTDLISDEYDEQFDRKTIIGHLNCLKDLVNENPDLLNIEFSEGNKENGHKKGSIAITERLFDFTDIKMIVDALNSSSSIPAKTVLELTKKLESFLSEYQKEDLTKKGSLKYINVHRTKNVEVPSNVELISTAIHDKKQISFAYFSYDLKGDLVDRHKGIRYYANPYELVTKNGHYYLIGNRPGDNDIAAYRLDYISDVTIEENRRDEVTSIDKYKTGFDINSYLDNHIYFNRGEIIKADVLLEGQSGIRMVYDWFGKNAKIINKNGRLIATITSEENSFFYWCMQYIEHITVLSPQSIVDRMNRNAQKIIDSKEILNSINENSKPLEIIFLSKYIYIKKRKYIMSEIEIHDFIQTLLNIRGNQRHYFGPITLVHSNDLFRKKYHEIEDGYRRIITSLILVDEILKYFKINNINFISDGCEEKSLESYYMIFAPQFEIRKNDCYKVTLDGILVDPEFIENSDYLYVSNAFKTAIKELENDKGKGAIKALFAKILNCLVFDESIKDE